MQRITKASSLFSRQSGIWTLLWMGCLAIALVNAVSCVFIEGTIEEGYVVDGGGDTSVQGEKRPKLPGTTEICQRKVRCRQDSDCGKEGRWLCEQGICFSEPEACRLGTYSCECLGSRSCPGTSICVEKRCWQVQCKEDCDCSVAQGTDVACGSYALDKNQGFCFPCEGMCFSDGDCPPMKVCKYYGLGGKCTYCGGK